MNPDELPAALELLGDKAFELTLNDWPNSELGLMHCIMFPYSNCYLIISNIKSDQVLTPFLFDFSVVGA